MLRFAIVLSVFMECFSPLAFAKSEYFFCETGFGNTQFDGVGFEGNIDVTNSLADFFFEPTVGFGIQTPIHLEQYDYDKTNSDVFIASGRIEDGYEIQILVKNQIQRRKTATFIFSGEGIQETRQGFCVINPIGL